MASQFSSDYRPKASQNPLFILRITFLSKTNAVSTHSLQTGSFFQSVCVATLDERSVKDLSYKNELGRT